MASARVLVHRSCRFTVPHIRHRNQRRSPRSRDSSIQINLLFHLTPNTRTLPLSPSRPQQWPRFPFLARNLFFFLSLLPILAPNLLAIFYGELCVHRKLDARLMLPFAALDGGFGQIVGQSKKSWYAKLKWYMNPLGKRYPAYDHHRFSGYRYIQISRLHFQHDEMCSFQWRRERCSLY